MFRPQRNSYFREVPWHWRDLLVGLVPLVAVRALVPLVARLNPDLGRSAWLRLLLILIAVCAYGWLVFYPLRLGRRRLGRWPRLPGIRAICVESLFALLVLPVVVVGMSVTFPVMDRLFRGPGLPSNPLEPAVRSNNPFDWPFMVVMLLVAAPIAEELFFRGLLYNALRQRIGFILAVFMQAIVFGALHLFDPASSATVAVIGLFLGLFYAWRKTLFSPMVLHSLVNVTAILATLNTPALGVYGEAHERGCMVTTVVPGGGADLAGLKPGDIITRVDGTAVTDIPSIARLVRRKVPGDSISVEFIRGQEEHRVEAMLKRLQD